LALDQAVDCLPTYERMHIAESLNQRLCHCCIVTVWSESFGCFPAFAGVAMMQLVKQVLNPPSSARTQRF
jgi:hypothetical protein